MFPWKWEGISLFHSTDDARWSWEEGLGLNHCVCGSGGTRSPEPGCLGSKKEKGLGLLKCLDHISHHCLLLVIPLIVTALVLNYPKLGTLYIPAAGSIREKYFFFVYILFNFYFFTCLGQPKMLKDPHKDCRIITFQYILKHIAHFNNILK